ncbi:hypothetical protein [uncultured Amnibacterium sp.]|uniref:hypothetical protein n=1 Tax=uncultured Amnibacterium sp. TaxID=1631851 RepID=UPI0035CAE292
MSYDGVAAVTTDEIAAALLELAIVVARYNSYEYASIPVAGEGRTEELTLMLGPTIHLSTLSVSAAPAAEIAGSAEIAAQLRRRAQTFTNPLHALGIEADA